MSEHKRSSIARMSLKDMSFFHTLGVEDYALYAEKLCVFEVSDCVGNAWRRVLGTLVYADFFSWIFVRQGSLLINIGDEQVVLYAGQMCFCRPRNILGVGSVSQGIHCCVVLFDGRLFELLHLNVQKVLPRMADNKQYVRLSMNAQQHEDMLRITQLLYSCIRSEGVMPNYDEMVLSLASYFMYAILSYILSNSELKMKHMDRDMSRYMVYFHHFMQELHRHYRRERKVSFYADRVCVSPKYLSSVVRAVSHRGPSEWIDECVITEAKNLLRFSNMSVQEVSNELNFLTQSYFGRYFKRHTGQSPRAYKLNKINSLR